MEQRIVVLIQPTLESMGYELVRVSLHGRECRTLQVIAERQNLVAMGVEDCAILSRVISAVLDAADLIEGSYVLEISSPGLDRPLTRKKDFVRFAGCETLLDTWQPISGRSRFCGRLLGLTLDGAVRLTLPEGGEMVIPQADIVEARLVPSNKRVDKVKRRKAGVTQRQKQRKT